MEQLNGINPKEVCISTFASTNNLEARISFVKQVSQSPKNAIPLSSHLHVNVRLERQHFH
jgi:hypothetical protein